MQVQVSSYSTIAAIHWHPLSERAFPGTARDLLHLRMRLAAQRQVQVSKSGRCGAVQVSNPHVIKTQTGRVRHDPLV